MWPLQSVANGALVRRPLFTNTFGQVDVPKIKRLNMRLPEDGAKMS
jgi:hypothetical protein